MMLWSLMSGIFKKKSTLQHIYSAIVRCYNYIVSTYFTLNVAAGIFHLIVVYIVISTHYFACMLRTIASDSDFLIFYRSVGWKISHTMSGRALPTIYIQQLPLVGQWHSWNMLLITCRNSESISFKYDNPLLLPPKAPSHLLRVSETHHCCHTIVNYRDLQNSQTRARSLHAIYRVHHHGELPRDSSQK
jgi:hypothetical protein